MCCGIGTRPIRSCKRLCLILCPRRTGISSVENRQPSSAHGCHDPVDPSSTCCIWSSPLSSSPCRRTHRCGGVPPRQSRKKQSLNKQRLSIAALEHGPLPRNRKQSATIAGRAPQRAGTRARNPYARRFAMLPAARRFTTNETSSLDGLRPGGSAIRRASHEPEVDKGGDGRILLLQPNLCEPIARGRRRQNALYIVLTRRCGTRCRSYAGLPPTLRGCAARGHHHRRHPKPLAWGREFGRAVQRRALRTCRCLQRAPKAVLGGGVARAHGRHGARDLAPPNWPSSFSGGARDAERFVVERPLRASLGSLGVHETGATPGRACHMSARYFANRSRGTPKFDFADAVDHTPPRNSVLSPNTPRCSAKRWMFL